MDNGSYNSGYGYKDKLGSVFVLSDLIRFVGSSFLSQLPQPEQKKKNSIGNRILGSVDLSVKQKDLNELVN